MNKAVAFALMVCSAVLGWAVGTQQADSIEQPRAINAAPDGPREKRARTAEPLPTAEQQKALLRLFLLASLAQK